MGLANLPLVYLFFSIGTFSRNCLLLNEAEGKRPILTLLKALELLYNVYQIRGYPDLGVELNAAVWKNVKERHIDHELLNKEL